MTDRRPLALLILVCLLPASGAARAAAGRPPAAPQTEPVRPHAVATENTCCGSHGLFRPPCCMPHWCPDDYCPKPAPCVRWWPFRRTCDDYCPKLQPCVPPRPICAGGDDYCPKPAPAIRCPAAGKCGSAGVRE